MVPINLEKEYDRVPREVMWWIFEASSHKCIEVIKHMYYQCYTRRRAVGTGAPSA